MRTFLAAALLVAGGTAGCLDPFRAHVDPQALAASSLQWVEVREPRDSGGWFGANVKETRYTFDPPATPADGPPYPGVLQVFSIRELDRRSTDALLDFTEAAIEEAAERESIVVDEDARVEGERVLANGLSTRWLTLEGRVSDGGALFAEDTVVRLIGEVAHDGRSRTSIVAVGYVQVDSVVTCPILVSCQSQQDFATWNDVAGDPAGSVGGATSTHGFIHHLVTHE